MAVHCHIRVTVVPLRLCIPQPRLIKHAAIMIASGFRVAPPGRPTEPSPGGPPKAYRRSRGRGRPVGRSVGLPSATPVTYLHGPDRKGPEPVEHANIMIPPHTPLAAFQSAPPRAPQHRFPSSM